MKSRPRCWIERVDLYAPDVAAEDRRRLARLRAQVDATHHIIEGSRRCVAETLTAIARLDRMIEENRSR